MQVLDSHQVQWNYQTLQVWIYRECSATASALPSNPQPSDPTALLQEIVPTVFIQLFYGSMNTPDWYNIFNQAVLIKQTIPSSLSPQAVFCHTPKIFAVLFSLPCGLGIVWFQQTCTLCYWNPELQWLCNLPSTSSTQIDVLYAATAVALKAFYLHITC